MSTITAKDRVVIFILIIAGTVVGLAGTDLVLPAIPTLPSSIDGTINEAQLVLATFTGGMGLGLLMFGELGARYPQRYLLAAALLGFGLLSCLAAWSESISELIAYRSIQGVFAAAPAVFAPGMVRALFAEHQAVRALGLMGSIESIVPALAPVAGAALLLFFDWRASFYVIAVPAFLLSVVWLVFPLEIASAARRGSYLGLLRNKTFLRYALSQAFTLGGLLIFVFGAPTVITITMGGTLKDFVMMQIIGISLFAVASNTTHYLIARIGAEATIMCGSAIAAIGSLCVLVFALIPAEQFAAGKDPRWLWLLFSMVNIGLGVRGPPGFYKAIVASGHDDARGAALVILAVFLVAAGGTAMLAPVITFGLLPLSMLTALVCCSSVLVLRLYPALQDHRETHEGS